MITHRLAHEKLLLLVMPQGETIRDLKLVSTRPRLVSPQITQLGKFEKAK